MNITYSVYRFKRGTWALAASEQCANSAGEFATDLEHSGSWAMVKQEQSGEVVYITEGATQPD